MDKFYPKGGTAFIDCTGLNLLGQSTQTITGLYKQIDAAFKNDKMIVAVNCDYDNGSDTEIHLTPVPVFCKAEGGRYCLTASILQVWVNEDDEVTIVSLIGG